MRATREQLPDPTWLEPGDAERHWKRDLAHFPGQITELDGELLRTFISGGFTAAMEAHGFPFRFLVRRLWTYYYDHDALVPMSDEERETMRARMGPARERIRTSIGERWRDDWLPEIHAHLAFWDAVDPAALDAAALSAHLEATLERGARLWLVHFELALALSFAKSALIELYDELFTPESPLEAQTLLSGFDVLTTRAARALWPLRELVGTGTTRDVFLSVAPRDAWHALQAEPGAARLVAAVQDYLERYGQRSPYVLFSAPSLREEPASVMSMLRHMVERPDADPERLLALQRGKREAAEREALERLRAYPAPVRDEFASRLRDAQTAFVVGEDHNYLIDYSATARIRQVLLACGAALTRSGHVTRSDDVFHLRVDELRTALAGGDAALLERVAERRAELERFAVIDPPFELNAPAANSASGAGASDPEITDAAAPDPELLRGTAASAGVIRARARVVRSLDETHTLLPGEVLVTPTTGQAWTPLFATAAGLVTESGNLLSHSAVVAREYALPAVVALSDATRAIPSGALVEVDGGAGTVRVLERP